MGNHIIKLSLLASSILLCSGIGTVTATEVIDPKHLDPNVWSRIQADLKEQERSVSKSGIIRQGKKALISGPSWNQPLVTVKPSG